MRIDVGEILSIIMSQLAYESPPNQMGLGDKDPRPTIVPEEEIKPGTYDVIKTITLYGIIRSIVAKSFREFENS